MKNKKEKKEEIKKQETVTEVKECEHCEQYLLGWKRALADYDNVKKDTANERVRMREYITDDVVIDEKIENWMQGLLYVRTQLETVLSEMGAVTFGQVGDTFDPITHDAAGEREEKEAEAGKIIEIICRGWKRGDHVVRPAKVIVSK